MLSPPDSLFNFPLSFSIVQHPKILKFQKGNSALCNYVSVPAITSDCKMFTLEKLLCPSSLNSHSAPVMNPAFLLLPIDLVPALLVFSQILVVLYLAGTAFYMDMSYTGNTI